MFYLFHLFAVRPIIPSSPKELNTCTLYDDYVDNLDSFSSTFYSAENAGSNVKFDTDELDTVGAEYFY